MNKVILGLFGSSVRGDSYRDVDLVAFGNPRTIRSIQSRVLRTWDAGVVQRLSLNNYGGGGGGGGKDLNAKNQGILDVTLFDNREGFDAFARRNSSSLLLTSDSPDGFWKLLEKKADPDTADFVAETFTMSR